MPQKVLTAEQMRAVEQGLIEKGVCGLILMENAGRSAAELIEKRLPPNARVLVVCGLGNNGGDGYVAARHLALAGHFPFVWSAGSPSALSGDAKAAFEAAAGCDIPVEAIEDEQSLRQAAAETDRIDAIVDALFGIGLSRPLEGVHLELVRWMNQSGAPIYAIDIPSGIHADTGEIMGDAVRANVTVTFQCAKIGHLLFPGREYAGQLQIAPIGVISPNRLTQAADRLTNSDFSRMLPPRKMDAHKGEYGRALLVAGSAGMMGAGILAARSAARSGAGIVTVCAPATAAPALWSAVPEVLAFPIPDKEGKFSSHSVEFIKPLLEGKTCAAFGPGVGRSAGHLDVLRLLLGAQIPLVLDADGLNALSEDLSVLKGAKADVVLTPHPGEMARLMKMAVPEILEHPVERAKTLAKKTGATVLLKGATSVIVSPEGAMTFNTSGSPALSKGGSGDVLTGIILALLAQGLCGYDAARLGSLILGLAAENVGRTTENIGQAPETVLPTDVIEALPAAFARA